MSQFLTTRQVGELLSQPEWFIRRIVDRLSPAVDRFGHKRMIPPDRVESIRAAIEQHHARRRGQEDGLPC